MPGATQTPMLQPMLDMDDSGVLTELLAGIPLQRIAQPTEVAALVVFLASGGIELLHRW